MLANLRGARILLLQGPMGPFFAQLAKELRSQGCDVTKINFNGGDAHYYRDADAIDYVDSLDAWPDYVRGLIRERGITHLVLFGDLRNHHYQAIAEARGLCIPVYVFEEGYLRPDYVTLERDGVNARSTLSQDPDFYRQFASVKAARPAPIGHVFWYAAFIAATYSLAMFFKRHHYRHYRHHRDLHPIREGLRWVLTGTRHKLMWKLRDMSALRTFSGALSGKYFLVPLQVHNDFQVRGSAYNSVEAFITEVTQAFAAHASADQHLVFKHHPLDRAYRNYTQLLDDLREQLGLEQRIHYIADPHLPTLLRHARGTIVLNSTVGLSSLQHGTPTICIGTSFYSLAGLSYQGDLVSFLKDPGHVDRELIAGFSNYLARHNQLPGSFYKRKRLPQLSDSTVSVENEGTLDSGEFASVSGQPGPL